MAENWELGVLGLPKQKIGQLQAKGIHTVMDLAMYFPKKYYDFRTISSAANVCAGDVCALQGQVIDMREGNGRYMAVCEEAEPGPNGYPPQFCAVWFGQRYLASRIQMGRTYTFCGKVSEYNGGVQMVSPIAFSAKQADVCRIMPVYGKIRGMSTEYLIDSVAKAVGYLGVEYEETEKDEIARQLRLMPFVSAISQMHNPNDQETYKIAASRIAFETIYGFYSGLKKMSVCETASVTGIRKDKLVRKAVSSLPYQLTSDQRSAIEEIVRDAKAGKRINALVSGDVGCGKTVIAILAALLMCENGYQTIVMAPTLVLARQHYQAFREVTRDLGVQVALLTTETIKRDRLSIYERVRNGKIDILIGTHAVLNEDVAPCKLGLTVIDEEHKFGVEQKKKLEALAQAGIHHLSMTATPIPRSIANTVYGIDTRVIPIRTMPEGRLPVETEQCFSSKLAFERIYEEVVKGRQAYIVCPFIDTSEQEQFANVVSVSAVKAAADKFFAKKPAPVRCGVLTGEMPQKEMMKTIDAFVAHDLDVLISTTIVEVGVDVPNATIIAIMSAERFGLAALHQLRGRVGRSSVQSYCLLCAPAGTERLDVLCATHDGFEIAEQDMRMRGPGDILGTAQSGDSKAIDTIMRFPRLALAVRDTLGLA